MTNAAFKKDARMSDVPRLLSWFDDGSLVRPSAGVPNTVALARAVASLAGAPGVGVDAPARRIVDAVGRSDHYVFVLADGLGMNLVETLQETSFLRSHVAMEMQAVFPPSTAPALTSLATGRWPAGHGLLEWFLYVQSHGLTAVVLPFVERFSKRPLGEFGIAPGDVLTSPSRMPSFAYDVHCHLPQQIAISIYSGYFSGGAPTTGYDKLGDACKTIAARISTAPTPTYDYLYIPYVDAAEHEHGPMARQVRRILLDVEKALLQLAEAVAGRARIIITADHGLLHIDKHAQTEIEDGDELLDLLEAPPAGSARVLLCHVRDGQRDRFGAAFRARFGAAWVLLTTDEAEALRLFGPGMLSGAARRHLGDFVAVSRPAEAIVYKADVPMLGFHGGLAPDEMRIPLILA